ncbi:MAG: hypothetical protein NVS9B10_29390 [Nevskia sp.]
MDDSKLSAGEFKATCLKLMDEVAATGREIVVTKRGKPVVRIVPYQNRARVVAGSLADSMEFVGDVIEPVAMAWDPIAKWDRLELREPPAVSAAAKSARKSAKPQGKSPKSR